MNNEDLFKKVILAQDKHTQFLDATQKNYGYFYFGKNVDIVKKTSIPMVDLLSAVQGFTPNSDNPLQNIVSSFVDEISVSEFKTTVKPTTVRGKEPYESYSDLLESILLDIHKKSKRRRNMKALVFELLIHGYFGLYFDGVKYYPLSAYDVFPADKSVCDCDMQQFWVRKTQATGRSLKMFGVYEQSDDGKTEPNPFENYDDLELYPLYDVWCKDMDRNVLYTESGKVVYEQEFPYPKKYPIFIANTSEVINSFYTLPVVNQLIEKLKDYQDASKSVKDSASNIAKPLLVYDSESGIDVNSLQQGLKAGYKHVIVGKNRDGDINFKAPGQIPSYAQNLPDRIEESIMKSLGLNKAFLGHSNTSARERGALTRLIRTSFRKLISMSGVIEDAFTDLDEYIIKYLESHKELEGKRLGMNIEEMFTGPIRYQPTERFIAYSSDDTYENKMLVINKWKNKLIPTEDALEELGDNQARRTMKRMKEEMRENQAFSVELQKLIRSEAGTSLIEKVSGRLMGKLEYQFYITPIADGKIIVKAHITELDTVGFLLSDFSGKVLIKEYFEQKKAPLEQQNPTVEEEPEAPIVLDESTPAGEPIATKEDGRGRPATAAPDANADANKEIVAKEIPEEPASIPASSEPAPTGNEPGSPPLNEEPGEEFNESELEEYINRGKTIYNIEKYKHLDGMYLKEPHAKMIFQGRKMMNVMAKNSPEYLDKRLLLCGDRVYGVIIPRKIIENFDFKKTQRYHMVKDGQRKKWWGDKKLYLYMFEFHPFKFPAEYKKSAGQLTFFGKVNFNDQEPK